MSEKEKITKTGKRLNETKISEINRKKACERKERIIVQSENCI